MSNHRTGLPLPQRFVSLRVTLSDRFGADPGTAFRRRLLAYLTSTGIYPVLSPTRVSLIAHERAITSLDVSLIVAWLVEQPEVVLVRRTTPTN